MKDLFNSTDGYSTLSIKDLLDAREAYHYHLMNKKNVVATAIGYYRIRKNDYWPTPKNPNPDNSWNKDNSRTLENSEVRPYSWPAVLVFVDHWEPEAKLSNPNDVVPKTLFLPDSRKVPVCVIEAKRELKIEETIDESKVIFPKNIIGGGYPVITYTQELKRIASIGCLVSDGHLTYAITNKHVAGKPGTPIYSNLADEEKIIGYTSDKQISRILFNEIYPSWNARETYLNMDVGLIEVLDLNEWKTEVYSIGNIGRIADLSHSNISLNLIGQPVTGYGSVSGKITGEIKALFYRYKAIGGFEYVSDFLIGSRDDKPLNIHQGDSGTILLYERPDTTIKLQKDEKPKVAELMPIGMVWGQHILYGNGEDNKSPYALATCLSTVCNILGVDIVREWNLDQPEIWGKYGHYTVGNFSIDCIRDKNFNKLMKQNLTNISFEINEITADWDSKNKATKEKYRKMFAEFCPLADVPDIIWKQAKYYSKTKTGYKWGRKGDENPNHYMDGDIPCKAYDGKTFLEYATDKSKVTVDEIQNYYEHADIKAVGMKDKPTEGHLPLRVWQAYDYMVDALSGSKPNIAKFIFCAGALTHYCGDACQPLHSSYMSNGDPADDIRHMVAAKRDSFHKDGTPSHIKGKKYPKVDNEGNGVHAAYEDAMIDENGEKILKGIKKIISENKASVMKEDIPEITDGQSAAYAIVDLLRKTQNTIKPADIVKAYKKYKSEDNLIDLLWDDFGQKTINCMVRGARYQAAIWEAAWASVGLNPKDFNIDFKSKEFRKKLKTLYNNPEEFKSYHLSAIKSILK